MIKARKRRLLIARADQREALTSTVRMELLEQLQAVGPATIADLAGRMGRSSHSLYHHVRQLLSAALIRRVDTRRSGARDQAVYDVVAELLEVPAGPGNASLDQADNKTVRVILRQVEREFRAALADDPIEMRSGEFYVGRMRARISRKAHKELLKHVQAIQRVFTEEARREHDPRTRLRTCALTLAFVPSPSGHDG